MVENYFVDKSIAFVRKNAKAHEIPKYRLAIESGLSSEALKKFDDPNWNPTRKTLLSLEKFFNKNYNHLNFPKSKNKRGHSDAP